MPDIQVTWQLACFVTAMFGLPIALAPIITSFTDKKNIDSSVAMISGGVAGGMVLMMMVAAWSRILGARSQLRPDGSPMATWVVKQLAIGITLTLLGAAVVIGLFQTSLPHVVAYALMAVPGGPGLVMIGKALSPVRGS